MRKISLLTIGMFALGFDAYIVAGLLPDICATFQISESIAGQAVSVFTLCYALAAPIFATLFAGKPLRDILVFALAVFTLANVASALAPNFLVLLIARAIAGMGAGLFSPLASVGASSIVSKPNRGRALGLILGGMSMGTVVGVPVGLIMEDYMGWQGPLWLIASISLIALGGILTCFPNIKVQAVPSLRQRLVMLTNNRVLTIVSITFITSVASLGLYTYISVLFQNTGGNPNITPFLWTWGIGGVVGSFSIGPLIDRTGKSALLMGGILAILMFAMFCLPFAMKHPSLVFLPFFFWGAMGWASQAPQQHVLFHTPHVQGESVIALNSSANYLGSAVGSMLGGFALSTILKPDQLPLAAGSLVLIALIGQITILLTRIKIHNHKIERIEEES
ncbi:MAG: MFS transporter [Bacillota bacterium]|nr:MFS transporter [Bacillota bacterium]